jgi:hypothetical protein
MHRLFGLVLEPTSSVGLGQGQGMPPHRLAQGGILADAGQHRRGGQGLLEEELDDAHPLM